VGCDSTTFCWRGDCHYCSCEDGGWSCATVPNCPIDAGIGCPTEAPTQGSMCQWTGGEICGPWLGYCSPTCTCVADGGSGYGSWDCVQPPCPLPPPCPPTLPQELSPCTGDGQECQYGAGTVCDCNSGQWLCKP
jgi:hypothetical protein